MSEPSVHEQAEFDRLFWEVWEIEQQRKNAFDPFNRMAIDEIRNLANQDFATFCIEHRGKTFRLPGGEEGDK